MVPPFGFEKTPPPNITAAKVVADSAKKLALTGHRDPESSGRLSQAAINFCTSLQGRRTIAFGTDAGVYAHGKLDGIPYMTEAGMPAMETIQAATTKAADLIESVIYWGD